MTALSDGDLNELQQLSARLGKGNYYELFGLEQDFQRGELRRAYYELSRRFHPDRFFRLDLDGKETLVEEVFAGINEAYRVLGDPEERRKYDRQLEGKGQSPRRRRRPATDDLRPPRSPADASPPQAPPGAKPEAPASEAPKAAPRAPEPDPHVINWSRSATKPADAAPEPEKRKKKRKKKPDETVSPAVAQLKQQMVEHLKRGRRYFKQGQLEQSEGQWTKAAASYYLAMKHDPRNEEYQQSFQEANRRSRALQAERAIELGRKSESFRNFKEAIAHYEEAARCDPDTGEPWYRLARLRIKEEGDSRGAISDFRKAIEKEPSRLDYRLALALVFEELDMKLNAHREFAGILKIDPKHEVAKAGARRTR